MISEHAGQENILCILAIPTLSKSAHTHIYTLYGTHKESFFRQTDKGADPFIM